MKSPEMGDSSPEKESAGIKEKLANLEQYMPGQEETIYEFARFLSTRADDTLVPQGFDLMAALALYDLQNGKDGFTGKPIQGKLIGYPPQIYTLLQMYVPQMKEIIFGKEK
ncbi:MAG: hypothetical protein Q8P83_00610 [bacterium]|nr:hypothetical protein [bacterium]